jgi:hypothetical protein
LGQEKGCNGPGSVPRSKSNPYKTCMFRKLIKSQVFGKAQYTRSQCCCLTVHVEGQFASNQGWARLDAVSISVACLNDACREATRLQFYVCSFRLQLTSYYNHPAYLVQLARTLSSKFCQLPGDELQGYWAVIITDTTYSGIIMSNLVPRCFRPNILRASMERSSMAIDLY